MGYNEITIAPEECKHYCDFLCDGAADCKPAYCLASNALFVVVFALLGCLIGILSHQLEKMLT